MALRKRQRRSIQGDSADVSALVTASPDLDAIGAMRRGASAKVRSNAGGSVVGGGVFARRANGLDAPFDPSTVTTLHAWYHVRGEGREDGEPISSVSDRSGEGAEDLTQATSSRRPTFDEAEAAISKPDGDDCLIGSSYTEYQFLHEEAASITFRIKMDPNKRTYFCNTDWGPETGEGIVFYWIETLQRWILRVAGTNLSHVGDAPPDGEWCVITGTWGSGGISIYLNGVLLANHSTEPAYTSGVQQASVFVLGAAYFAGNVSAWMKITDVVIGRGELDAAGALAMYEGLI